MVIVCCRTLPVLSRCKQEDSYQTFSKVSSPEPYHRIVNKRRATSGGAARFLMSRLCGIAKLAINYLEEPILVARRLLRKGFAAGRLLLRIHARFWDRS